MRELTYRLAFLACSVASSNPRVRKEGGREGGYGFKGREGEKERGEGGMEGGGR